jgi:hypothetical protein
MYGTAVLCTASWFMKLEASLWISCAHAPCPIPYTLISSEIFRSQQQMLEWYLKHAVKGVPKLSLRSENNILHALKACEN